MPAHDVLHLGGKEVHPTHREHVVHATGNAADDLHEGTSTRAWLARYHYPIARAVANQWHSPSAKVGGDQLAILGHLEDELRFDEVHSVSGGAAEAGRSQLGHPGVVERDRRVGRLDRVPRRGNACSRLAGVNGRAHAGPGHIDPDLLRHLREPQGVGRGGQEDGRADVQQAARPLLARHPAARDAQRAKLLRPAESRPETDEGTEREGEEDPVGGRHARGAVNMLRPDPKPPFPRLGRVEPPQGLISARP